MILKLKKINDILLRCVKRVNDSGFIYMNIVIVLGDPFYAFDIDIKGIAIHAVISAILLTLAVFFVDALPKLPDPSDEQKKKFKEMIEKVYKFLRT